MAQRPRSLLAARRADVPVRLP